MNKPQPKTLAQIERDNKALINFQNHERTWDALRDAGFDVQEALRLIDDHYAYTEVVGDEAHIHIGKKAERKL